MSVASGADGERLVLFEVGGAAYALPISDVLEVSEFGQPAGIPTLPRRVAAVANHHGDALPILARRALFEESEEGFPEPVHVLVIAGRSGRSGRLGLPVDRVLGIVPGAPAAPGGAGLVVERRQVEGRVVGILDVQRLFEEAARAVERASDADTAFQEGGP